jgi:putative transposase
LPGSWSGTEPAGGLSEQLGPKLRGTTEAFASRLFGSHVTKTNALESLVIASFIRVI